MFGEWVKSEDINRVLNYCCKFNNTYLFQTKNPARFRQFLLQFPEKSILCTTIESNRDYEYLKISDAPHIYSRISEIGFLKIHDHIIDKIHHIKISFVSRIRRSIRIVPLYTLIIFIARQTCICHIDHIIPI